MATNTAIQVEVDGGAPVLVPDLPTDQTTIVGTSPLHLTGSVRQLSQIRVYVDDVAAGVVSLPIGATSFSVDIALSVGPHTIRLVGVSLSGPDSLVVTMHVTYTPAADSMTGEERAGNRPGINTVTSGDQLPTQSTSMSAQALITMPDWLRSWFVTIDFVRPDDTGWNVLMLRRFFLIVIGLFMLICAKLVLRGYRKVRYGWLGWRKRPLPEFVRQRPLLWIRLVGLSIILLVLWLS